MPKPYTFLISDETLNRDGYRILTKGIDTANFLKNPVCLYVHNRPGWDNRKAKPVGRWENLRKENDQLLADFVPSEATEESREIWALVEDGTLRACSISVSPIKLSESTEDLLPGQYRATVVKSELIEISIVDIPGNANAVRLSHASGDDIESVLPKLNLNHNHNSSNQKMTNLLKLLGATDEASALMLVAELQKDKAELAEAKNRILALEAKEKDASAQAIIDLGYSEGRFLESQKEFLLSFAKQDPEGAKAFIATMKPRASLMGKIQPDEKVDSGLSDAKLFKLKWDEGKLKEWQKANPEEYERCSLAYKANR